MRCQPYWSPSSLWSPTHILLVHALLEPPSPQQHVITSSPITQSQSLIARHQRQRLPSASIVCGRWEAFGSESHTTDSLISPTSAKHHIADPHQPRTGSQAAAHHGTWFLGGWSWVYKGCLPSSRGLFSSSSLHHHLNFALSELQLSDSKFQHLHFISSSSHILVEASWTSSHLSLIHLNRHRSSLHFTSHHVNNTSSHGIITSLHVNNIRSLPLHMTTSLTSTTTQSHHITCHSLHLTSTT